MQTKLGHMQFNVQPAHMPFYRDLLSFLGWKLVYDTPEMLGAESEQGTSLWFAGQVKEGVSNDYDGPGLNHLAFGTAAQADVDAAAAHLSAQGVALLFETPRHRPEFSMSAEETYYQIMFETPDKILIEVVYTGPKEA
jgi:catechol 2,3-dioxygenase-like lactoylglutathione lyase family enzyme